MTHMYASEPHFGGITDKLKLQMRKSIRENRCLARPLLATRKEVFYAHVPSQA